MRTPKPKDYFIALKPWCSFFGGRVFCRVFSFHLEFHKGVFIVEGVNEHIENFNSEPCGRHFGHLFFSKGRETGDQFGRTVQPKYGVFTYTQIWLKKSPLRWSWDFFWYTLVYARLYDSAASSASPLGSAASLATSPLLSPFPIFRQVRPDFFRERRSQAVPDKILESFSVFQLLVTLCCNQTVWLSNIILNFPFPPEKKQISIFFIL